MDHQLFRWVLDCKIRFLLYIIQIVKLRVLNHVGNVISTNTLQ